VIPRRLQRVVYRPSPSGGSMWAWALFGLAIASALVSLIGIVPAVNASGAKTRLRALEQDAVRLAIADDATSEVGQERRDRLLTQAIRASREVERWDRQAAETSAFIIFGLGGAVVLTLGAIFLKIK
jgi:hypothetical protein